MQPLDPSALRGAKVAVWGAARSGRAAANLLADLGADVVLSDPRERDEIELPGLDPRVKLEGGGNRVHGALLVPSPGIKPHTPALREAIDAGVRVVSEIELAAALAAAPVVAITGTDGKSTTTAMIGAVVEAAGRPAVVAGNIGVPLSERVRDVGPEGVVVAEVSAFQLWSCGFLRPRVSVVTNVAEDHLEYFQGDAHAYAMAKARVLRDQGPGDTAILKATDAIVSKFPVPDGVRVEWFAPEAMQRGWGVTEAALTRDGEAIFPRADLPLPGPHNAANALCALAAGAALGLDLEAMREGLQRFEGLPHRLQRVRELDGVNWYNDSKATNPHAAAAGLRALSQPLVVIGGGYEKGLDLTPYLDALRPHTRHLVLVGPTSDRIEAELSGAIPATRAETQDEAIRIARRLAHPGDAVVLSPAASSFDAWKSFEHRGDAFLAAVRALR